MADSMIDVVNEILRATQQESNKTELSDNDDTNFIADRVNDALEDIYRLQPTFREGDGTVTITPSTRTFSTPLGGTIEIHLIHNWSYRINDANGDIPLEYVTKEFIVKNFPLYETQEGDIPRYVYTDADLIAIYPLLTAGADNLTMQFSYSEALTKLEDASNTFPFTDRSDEMRFVKLSAQLDYEIYKGLGLPVITQGKKEALWGTIYAKHAKLKRQGFKGYRRYGS